MPPTRADNAFIPDSREASAMNMQATHFLWRYRRADARRAATTRQYMTPSEALRWALARDITEIRRVAASGRVLG